MYVCMYATMYVCMQCNRYCGSLTVPTHFSHIHVTLLVVVSDDGKARAILGS